MAAAYVNDTIGRLSEADQHELARLLEKLGIVHGRRVRRARRRRRARSAARRRGSCLVSRLLRERLAPYRRSLVIIFALLLVQAIANLSLPTLNADIITHGIATGDIHYIVRIGGVCSCSPC